jgi:cohesin loading factor subunit SCC2
MFGIVTFPLQKIEVNMLLYMADNLACFPYQIQEEPLFIMHHIDITLSVSGSNLLQSFKEVGDTHVTM